MDFPHVFVTLPQGINWSITPSNCVAHKYGVMYCTHTHTYIHIYIHTSECQFNGSSIRWTRKIVLGSKMISISTLDYLRVSQPLSFSEKKNTMATVFPKSLAPSFKIFGSLVARKFLEWSMSAHFTGTLCKTSLCHSMPSLGHLKSGSGRSSCSDWVVRLSQKTTGWAVGLGNIKGNGMSWSISWTPRKGIFGANDVGSSHQHANQSRSI